MSNAPPEGPPLDIARIVEALNRYHVAYVIIGGVAAEAWALSQGVTVRPTQDIDITPEAGRVNLQRLSDAMFELDARIRTDAVPQGLAFSHDGESLSKANMWTLITRFGPFDISIIPNGTHGYEDLAQRARVVVVEGVDAPLADLADVIRSKRAANRAKDHETLPALEEALRRRDATE